MGKREWGSEYSDYLLTGVYMGIICSRGYYGTQLLFAKSYDLKPEPLDAGATMGPTNTWAPTTSGHSQAFLGTTL